MKTRSMKSTKAVTLSENESNVWPEMTFIYVMPLLEEQNGYAFLENGAG